MTPYEELSREQLIKRLSLAEEQLKEFTFSPKFALPIEKPQPQNEAIAMAFVKADGIISYVNSSLCELNGFSEEEIVGNPISNFIVDEDKQWSNELLKEMVEGETELFRGEHNFISKDGNSHCFDVVVIAVRDDKGKFFRANYIFNDISTSKSNERELIDLLDTQKRIASALLLIMQNDTGNYENDILKIILERYNADRAYIFQFDWQKGYNRNISEVVADGISCEIDNLQYIPNSAIADPILCFSQSKPFILNSLDVDDENNDWDKDILLEQNIKSIILFPIFISNELWGYLGIDMVKNEKIWNDKEIEWLNSFTSVLSVGLARKFAIDELDKQQKLFHLILDSGSLGYLKIDIGANRIECSENYLSLFGYTIYDKEIDLDSLWNIVHPNDLPNLKIFLQKIVAGTTDERSIELRIMNRSNKWMWVLSKVVEIEYNTYTESHLITIININIDQTKQTALAIIEKDAQLRQNESKDLELYQNMNLGYAHNEIVCDASGNIVDFIYLDVNPVFESMIKIPKEKLLGKRAIQNGYKFSPNLMELYADVAINGISRHHEYYSEQLQGWYNMSIYSPKQGEFIVLLNDISLRYKAHELIRLNEQKLRTVFENIPVGIALYDKNGDYMNCNAEISHIFDDGFEKDDEDTNLILRIKKINPDWNVETNLSFELKYDKALHKIVDADEKNENVLYLLFKVMPLIDSHTETVNGYLIITIDETEHKTLESSLREAKEKQEVTNSILSSVLELSHVLPWDCNIPTQTFSCDYNIYHHESQKESINGKYYCTIDKYIDSIHPDYREHMKEVFGALVSGERKDFHEIYRVHWYNDREYEWIDKQGAVYEYDENGVPKTIIGSTVVITERKHMEQSLLNALDQAEQSNRLKSAFLANMSHEIRTPLNAIVGFSEMLTTVEDPKERKEYAEIITNNNQLLLQLISDILDISKIEAGTLEFVYSSVDVNALMQNGEMAARFKVDSDVVKITCENGLQECIISSEKNRLLQVINNLVGNAIKFTSKGEIKLGYKLQDDQTLYFYVQDTGCGIPENETENVFGRFVKLNNFIPGTGLGLSICETIVSKLGGKIGVESREGVGSKFWFTIPYSKVSEADTKKHKLHQLRKNGSIRLKSKPRILIAEDNESNYMLFETILRKNYTLKHAWNGLEAVEMFGEEQPDIILMDLKMPELGGIDATVIIRETSKEIPIIAITAFAFGEDKEKALDAGCNDFLTKPINAKELLALIDKYLI